MATESEIRKQVAEWLDQYKGIKEGGAEHKAILAVFNDSGLCSRYKMTVSDAWCAAAASAAFIACGLSDIFPCVECSCSKMISMAQTAGIWVEDDSYKPGIGDCILYDWDDSGSGDNAGAPDHVGIVQDVSGSVITAIEGNKNKTVGTREISVNGKFIRGYITPDFSSAAAESGNASGVTASGGLAVGDIVTYTGTKHYASANATEAKTCKGGKAEVTQICKGAKHPYHLIHTGSGCTVYGWVDETDIEGLSSSGASTSATPEKKASDAAQSYDASLAGTYKTTANLNMRAGAGTDKAILVTLPSGTTVQNYGYYTSVSGTKWLYVQVTYNGIKYTGFCSGDYLKKE